VRKNRLKISGIDAFMMQYYLSSDEGVVMICLVESLLHITDKYTIDLFIKDELSEGNWHVHLGNSDYLFVNAAIRSLMLTGKELKDSKPKSL